MENKKPGLVEEEGGITAVVWSELRSTLDEEHMLDDVGEDFRDRPWPAIGEHLFEAGTAIAIATAPVPSTPAKTFGHALKSGLNVAHV
jgi:hypothetical protein